MLGTALIFASCGGDSEESEDKKEASVTDYADKFCECMKENDNDMTECVSILEEAKEKFPDGEKDFKKTLDECGVNM